jgi:hypothetical protein
VDAEQIKELTQAVLDLKADMIAQDQAAQAAVQDAKDAAERALQAAEEARYEYDAAARAYQAKKAELRAAIDSLDTEEES